MAQLFSLVRDSENIEDLMPLITQSWKMKDEFKRSLCDALISVMDNDRGFLTLAAVTLRPFEAICSDNFNIIMKFIYRKNGSDDYLCLVCKEWKQWFDEQTRIRMAERKEKIANLFHGQSINVGTNAIPDLSTAIRVAEVNLHHYFIIRLFKIIDIYF